MTPHYEIEDISHQDGRGVSYRARDNGSGERVLLRRFFPEGVGNAGLSKDEQDFYLESLAWMKVVKHPHLRSIREGGVDEIDGIPWIVAEEPRGKTLAVQMPLDRSDARVLLQQGMDLLSLLDGQGDYSIDFDPSRVMFSRDDQGVAFFTFTLCPVLMLAGRQRDSLREFALLLEWALGFSGPSSSSEPSTTLPGWINRARVGTWSVAEAANEASQIEGEVIELISSGAQVPEVPFAPEPRERQVQLLAQAEQRGSRWFWVASLIFLGAMSAGAYLMWQGGHLDKEIVNKRSESGDQPSNQLVLADGTQTVFAPVPGHSELQAAKREKAAQEAGVRALFADQAVAQRMKLEVLDVGGKIDLRSRDGKWVILVGKVDRVRASKSGKTRYIEYDRDPRSGKPCGMVSVSKLKDSSLLSLEVLSKLEAQRVALLGKLRYDARSRRYVIDLTDKSEFALVK